MDKKEKKDLEREAIINYLGKLLTLEKEHSLLPGSRNPATVASFLGLKEDELEALKEGSKDKAMQAAEELLKDAEIREKMENIPFKKGDKIVGVGDDITSDFEGWFEIFRYVVDTARPDLELEWINAGVYQNTTHDVLRRLNNDVMHTGAAWVILHLGTYDAQRLHTASERTHVSLAEFWENLNSIDLALQEVVDNPLIWISPSPVITEQMMKVPVFEGIIQEDDLTEFREVLSGKTGYVVDPQGLRFGRPANSWNFLADGLHPSIAGHLVTVRELIHTLTKGKVVGDD